MTAGNSHEEFSAEEVPSSELIKVEADVDGTEEDEFDEFATDLGELDALLAALLGDEGPVPNEDDTVDDEYANVILKPGQSLIDYKCELEVRAFAEWSEIVPVLATADIRESIHQAEAGLVPWQVLYDAADHALMLVAITGQADH